MSAIDSPMLEARRRRTLRCSSFSLSPLENLGSVNIFINAEYEKKLTKSNEYLTIGHITNICVNFALKKR
jgi:hypothetical protein